MEPPYGKEERMTIRIEPHYRLRVLPNVGVIETDDALLLLVELENTRTETVSAANLVAVAYREDGTICGVEDSTSFATIRENERKAVKIRLELDAKSVDLLRLYAETEFDDDDPVGTASEEPPGFMQKYFRQRTDQ